VAPATPPAPPGPPIGSAEPGYLRALEPFCSLEGSP
jgi:hypothetical protein